MWNVAWGGAVGRIAPGRAGVPGEASFAETACAGGMLDMRNTSIDVVAVRGERADGTGGKAGALDATLARTPALVARGKVETFAKCDRAPVGVPQAVVRVHQRPDGRGVQGSGPLRPPDERQPGRAAEREVRDPAEGVRQTGDDPPAPSVQGVRRTVLRLLRCREGRPHPGPGVADEEERPRGCAVSERRDRVVRGDVERATAREPFGLGGGDDGVETPRRRCATGSGVFHANAREGFRHGSRDVDWCGFRERRVLADAGVPPALPFRCHGQEEPCRQASRYS